MPDSFTVTVERPELWLVTFDNPPLNKVDPEMILKLQALVGQLEADPDVKVVVFDSAIPEHFLGPYDMTRAADTPSEPGPTGLPPWLDLTVRLARLPVVSIAVIRGVALGCGNEFACSCAIFGSPASSGRPSSRSGSTSATAPAAAPCPGSLRSSGGHGRSRSSSVRSRSTARWRNGTDS